MSTTTSVSDDAPCQALVCGNDQAMGYGITLHALDNPYNAVS